MRLQVQSTISSSHDILPQLLVFHSQSQSRIGSDNTSVSVGRVEIIEGFLAKKLDQQTTLVVKEGFFPFLIKKIGLVFCDLEIKKVLQAFISRSRF